MDWFDLTSFLKPDLLYLFLIHRSLPVPNQVVLDVPSCEGTLEFPHTKIKKNMRWCYQRSCNIVLLAFSLTPIFI